MALAWVRDEEGLIVPCGDRFAACLRTYLALTGAPLRDNFLGILLAVLTEPRAWCTAHARIGPTAASKAGVFDIGCDQDGNSCR